MTYAELYGNIQKYGIKSPCGNKWDGITISEGFNDFSRNTVLEDNMKKVSAAFVAATKSLKPCRIDLGEPSPLYRVTGTDHRVNSTDIPSG